MELDEQRALRAMAHFLEAYLDRTNGLGQIAPLLADIELVGDCETSDPAAWGDWVESVNATDSARRTGLTERWEEHDIRR